MKNIKLGLFLFSCLGLIISILVHLGLRLDVNIQDYPVSPYILHLGIFITFAPSLILFIFENKNLQDENGRQVGVKAVFSDSPKALSIFVSIVYAYAILNFVLFMGSMPGAPTKQGEKYILSNHGTVIKEITFGEYKAYQRKEAIGFSGHWMLFYSAALLLSYPFRKKREVLITKEQVIVNRLQLSKISFLERLYEKGKILFILSGISLPIFFFFLFTDTNFGILILTGIFPLNLLLNLYYFVKWSKYFIQSYSIEYGFIKIEVYHYNSLVSYKFPFQEIQLKLEIKSLRGGELVYLTFLDLKNKEIFSQYESKLWSPNMLRDLERAFTIAKKTEAK